MLSASRDKSVRLWKALASSPPTYDCSFVSTGSDFVNSVAFVPPSDQFSEGLVVAGGRDAIIEVRTLSKLPQDNADALLLGHAGNVCALDVSEDGQWIVSGSWDTEARLWQVGRWGQSVQLQGHTASVWAVCYYDKETIITGKWLLLSTTSMHKASNRAACTAVSNASESRTILHEHGGDLSAAHSSSRISSSRSSIYACCGVAMHVNSNAPAAAD